MRTSSVVHFNENWKSSEEITITLTFTVALLFRAVPSISRIIYQANNLSFKFDIVKKYTFFYFYVKKLSLIMSRLNSPKLKLAN